MKKFSLIILTVICLTATNCKRNNPYNLAQFYKKYQPESELNLKFSGLLASALSESKEDNQWLRNLKHAKIVVIDKTETRNIGNIRNDLISALEGENLEELVNINSDESYISVQVFETKDKVKKLVIGLDSKEDFLLIDTKTNINLGDLDELISDVNENGKKSKSIQILF